MKGGDNMSEIVKKEVTAEDLALINQCSKAELTANDVYTVDIVCCDNQVDRDIERFSDNALNQMAELYIGKTVIKDHNPKAENQVARIFKTRIDSGENGLKRLIASAYIPINGSTKELIQNIETGINKEVSVGFVPTGYVCSVCEKDYAKCSHLKGREYSGKQCHVIFGGVSDVYELSFVAVPAQRNAGVIKSYNDEINTLDKIKKQRNLNLRLRLAKTQNFRNEVFDNEVK